MYMYAYAHTYVRGCVNAIIFIWCVYVLVWVCINEPRISILLWTKVEKMFRNKTINMKFLMVADEIWNFFASNNKRYERKKSTHSLSARVSMIWDRNLMIWKNENKRKRGKKNNVQIICQSGQSIPGWQSYYETCSSGLSISFLVSFDISNV